MCTAQRPLRPGRKPTKRAAYSVCLRCQNGSRQEDETGMFDHDILSDEEREALNEVMLAPPSQSPQRLLIVDDDKDAREILSEILSLNDISCITAAGGTSAMHLLQTR